MENALVNVNGQIVPGSAAQAGVFDRGFLYGDSLYEVVRSYDGAFFKLEEHLQRLEKSAALCHMVLGQSLSTYRKEIERTYEAFKKKHRGDAYCRIIVTRGTGKIGFGLECILTPTQYFIVMQPVEAPTPEQRKKGMALQISHRLRNDRRALDPAMKSGNYLNSLLAYLESGSEGFDDALLCDVNGHVTEGTTFNIFYVRRGIVATPPLDIGILDGITRRIVIGIAAKLGYPVREVRFPRERLYEGDEVFITSSIKEVFPITRIDGITKPIGPITKRLHAAYLEEIR